MIKEVIRDNIKDIVSEMNEEMFRSLTLRWWKKKGSHRTLEEHRDTYWADKGAITEFGTDLSVSFGKAFELLLPDKLNELGCKDVQPRFTSKGDMIDGVMSWENKTGQGKFVQGSTHSPKEKKPLNLIQFLWAPYKDKSLDDILKDRRFIYSLNVCVFENIKVDSIGTHSNNNSRTAIRIRKENIEVAKDACVYGDLKKNPKYVGFEKVEV